MAPSCVMLDTDVRLVTSTADEKTVGGWRTSSSSLKPQKEANDDESWGPPMSFVDRLNWLKEGGGSRSRKGKSPKAPPNLEEWVREGTIRVDTDKFLRAPEISTLSLHVPALPHLQGIYVKSADKGLLVLSTGPWRDYYASSGRYLVYDAAADALFMVPSIECCFKANPEIFGCRPVIMRTGEAPGDFILALVGMSVRTRQYCYLLTWSPALSQQWMCRDVCLPDDVVNYPFLTDITFAFDGHGGRLACWVDLHLGVLTCDVLSEDPKFQLKLLPEDYVMGYDRMARGRPDQHCTMGCGADGSIKFLYMDGFVDDRLPRDQVTIKTWTLVGQVPGSCAWVRDDHTTLSCGALWADESFLAIPGLPKNPPTLPILSHSEPDVVYVFFKDIDYVNRRINSDDEHVLGLNLRTKKVQTWTKCPPGRSIEPIPYFIATELSPSQESSNLDHQGNKYQNEPPDALDVFKDLHYNKKKGFSPTVQSVVVEIEGKLDAPVNDCEEPKDVTDVVYEVLGQKTKKSSFLVNVGMKSSPAIKDNAQRLIEAELVVEKKTNNDLREIVKSLQLQMDEMKKKMQEVEEARAIQDEEMKKKQAETDALIKGLISMLSGYLPTR